MSFSTSLRILWHRWYHRLRSLLPLRDPSSRPEPSTPEEPDPSLHALARPAPAVAPESRTARALEILRTGPYRVVPVVADPAAPDSGPLLGLLTEATLTALLLQAEPEERARIRETPVHRLMEPPPVVLSISQKASEAAAHMERLGVDVLPVADYQGRYWGLVARSDLVQELIRPFRPPLIGGMATPTGVYLTTGAVSGGVGAGALFLSGLAMFGCYFLAIALTQPLIPWLTLLPAVYRGSLATLTQSVVQMGLFLAFIRLSPMAGYHAAEHQVVHAVERAEPLLLDTVRRMPRVHPRCGTNLVAGAALFGIVGTALEPLLGEAGYLISGLVALTYWRTSGAWLQQHLTTKPATDFQLEGGIRAANELLSRYSSAPGRTAPPQERLWRMGFLQILAGFGLGWSISWLLLALFPQWLGALRPALEIIG